LEVGSANEANLRLDLQVLEHMSVEGEHTPRWRRPAKSLKEPESMHRVEEHTPRQCCPLTPMISEGEHEPR